MICGEWEKGLGRMRDGESEGWIISKGLKMRVLYSESVTLILGFGSFFRRPKREEEKWADLWEVKADSESD